jgi:hypothetical protein
MNNALAYIRFVPIKSLANIRGRSTKVIVSVCSDSSQPM